MKPKLFVTAILILALSPLLASTALSARAVRDAERTARRTQKAKAGNPPLPSKVRTAKPPSRRPGKKPLPGAGRTARPGKKPLPGGVATARPAGARREPALEGYCPAAYLLQGKAVKGDPKYRSDYAGDFYYLSSAAAKKKFDADPKHFLPQFGGLCTTALGGPYGNRLPGDPTVFDVRKGKVYLFSTERAKRAYVKNDPDWIIGQAEELSKKPVLRGRCPVSYFTAGRATPGKEKIKFLYRGSLYYFANKKARAAFIKDPQRYLPQYGGYSMDRCLDRRLNEPDPALFAVHEGKLYFFFSESGRARFLADPLAMIAEVDLHWAVITGKTD